MELSDGVVGALAGVIVGWFLTGISSLVRDRRNKKEKLSAIKTEVMELEDDLERAVALIKKELDIYLTGKSEYTISYPLKLELPITDSFFVEASTAMHTHMRKNVAFFRTWLKELNSSIERLTLTKPGYENKVKGFGARFAVYAHSVRLLTFIHELKGKGIDSDIPLDSDSVKTKLAVLSDVIKRFESFSGIKFDI